MTDSINRKDVLSSGYLNKETSIRKLFKKFNLSTETVPDDMLTLQVYGDFVEFRKEAYSDSGYAYIFTTRHVNGIYYEFILNFNSDVFMIELPHNENSKVEYDKFDENGTYLACIDVSN